MPGNFHRFCLIFLAIFSVFEMTAAVWVVPDDFPTIQAAVDAAGQHDTIMIMPGRYYENVEIENKAVTITSFYEIWEDESVRERTIIDAGFNGNGIEINGGEDTTFVSGLIVTNGRWIRGAGISVGSTTVVLEDMVIIGNETTQEPGANGGGVYVAHGNLVMIDCMVKDNIAHDLGGGVSVRGNSTSSLHRVVFKDNKVFAVGGHGKGGGFFTDQPGVHSVLTECLFAGNTATNWGGGLQFSSGAYVEIVHCTFTGNSAGLGGGALYTCYSEAKAFIGNSIMYNNTPDEIHFDEGCYHDTIRVCYSDIEDFEQIFVPPQNSLRFLAGCINEDPLFDDPFAGDYTLQRNSPCIDSGTDIWIENSDTLIYIPDSLYIGIAPDMGCYEFDPAVQLFEIVTHESQINVWPQPAKDRLYLSLDATGMIDEVIIYNLQGWRISSFFPENDNTLSFNISDLVPGLYILQLNHSGKILSAKFVKQ
jgi:hypothetical protein